MLGIDRQRRTSGFWRSRNTETPTWADAAACAPCGARGVQRAYVRPCHHPRNSNIRSPHQRFEFTTAQESISTVATMDAPLAKRSLSRKSTSFSLHSPSLNSLRLRRIFDLFDRNGDGLITVDEISQALGRLGLEAAPSELESTIRTHITPGSGGLRFEDFAALHREIDETFGGDGEEGQAEPVDAGAQEESDLCEAFKVFDENGDGYISAKELQSVLDKLGLVEGKEMARVEQMIGSVDRNQDGRVDFTEFKDMMRSVTMKVGR